MIFNTPPILVFIIWPLWHPGGGKARMCLVHLRHLEIPPWTSQGEAKLSKYLWNLVFRFFEPHIPKQSKCIDLRLRFCKNSFLGNSCATVAELKGTVGKCRFYNQNVCNIPLRCIRSKIMLGQIFMTRLLNWLAWLLNWIWLLNRIWLLN